MHPCMDLHKATWCLRSNLPRTRRHGAHRGRLFKFMVHLPKWNVKDIWAVGSPHRPSTRQRSLGDVIIPLPDPPGTSPEAIMP